MEPICTNFFARCFFRHVKNGCRLTAAVELVNVPGLYNDNEKKEEELLYLLVFVWSRGSEVERRYSLKNKRYVNG